VNQKKISKSGFKKPPKKISKDLKKSSKGSKKISKGGFEILRRKSWIRSKIKKSQKTDEKKITE